MVFFISINYILIFVILIIFFLPLNKFIVFLFLQYFLLLYYCTAYTSLYITSYRCLSVQEKQHLCYWLPASIQSAKTVTSKENRSLESQFFIQNC